MNPKEFHDQLKTGAFVLVDHPDKSNVMTIGWGGLVRMWNRDIMMVPVRTNRYTHELLDGVDEFIVAVPSEGEMLEELSFCGSRSGRDTDKLDRFHRTEQGGLTGCKNYRARIVMRQDMVDTNLKPDLLERHYPEKNMHTLYYCEIEHIDD